ncbi:MAG TPA: hypothetical protein VEK76_07845 [Candidatus Binatia bacterium]|nr:hypothetical protein [Candidatus Binatia bacterium]
MTVTSAPLPPALEPTGADDEPVLALAASEDRLALPAMPLRAEEPDGTSRAETGPAHPTAEEAHETGQRTAPAQPRSTSPRRARETRHAPAPALGPRLPRIVRPSGLAAAARPGDIPEPEHRHLPGWVRRAHGQARPILADLLGSLAGEARERYDGQVRGLVAGISAGRFSLAWQYPQLIDEGWALLEQHRRDAEAEARRRRGVETARRRVTDQLRDAGDRLAPETASRLHRTLRSAEDAESIREVGSELDHALTAARSVEERRRDREIHRTRERLRRSLPGGTAGEDRPESWQDALRRIAGQYSSD